MSVIIRPVLTEKYTRLGELEANKQYAFEVAESANKVQIKKEIEQKYGVEVLTCRTYVQRPERKLQYTRTRIIKGKTKRKKRAIVTLVGQQEINLYEN